MSAYLRTFLAVFSLLSLTSLYIPGSEAIGDTVLDFHFEGFMSTYTTSSVALGAVKGWGSDPDYERHEYVDVMTGKKMGSFSYKDSILFVDYSVRNCTWILLPQDLFFFSWFEDSKVGGPCTTGQLSGGQALGMVPNTTTQVIGCYGKNSDGQETLLSMSALPPKGIPDSERTSVYLEFTTLYELGSNQQGTDVYDPPPFCPPKPAASYLQRGRSFPQSRHIFGRLPLFLQKSFSQ